MRFDQTLAECVMADVRTGHVPMLLGEPGIGKSSWVEWLASDRLGTRAFTLPCNQCADKSDVTGARGVPVRDPDGSVRRYAQVFYPHAMISAAIDYAADHPTETPLLFLDEINRTTPDVTSELLSLPTSRVVGSEGLPDNLAIIVAGNDRGNVTALDEASVSRFSLYRVEPDLMTFLDVNRDVNPYIKKVLEGDPDLLFCREPTDERRSDDDDDDDGSITDLESLIDGGSRMRQITTPRSLTALSDWLNAMCEGRGLSGLASLMAATGDDEGTALEHCIVAHIGRTRCAEAILAGIAQDVKRGARDGIDPMLGKPDCVDELKAAGTMTDLQALCAKLPLPEASGALVYLICERADNEPIVKTLAESMDDMTAISRSTLLSMVINGRADRQNVEAFYRTDTELSRWFKSVNGDCDI